MSTTKRWTKESKVGLTKKFFLDTFPLLMHLFGHGDDVFRIHHFSWLRKTKSKKISNSEKCLFLMEWSQFSFLVKKLKFWKIISHSILCMFSMFIYTFSKSIYFMRWSYLTRRVSMQMEFLRILFLFPKYFVGIKFSKLLFSLLPSTVPKNNEGERDGVVLKTVADFNSKLDECWCSLWDSFARKYDIPLSKKIRMKLVANFVFLEALVCLSSDFFVSHMFFSNPKSITGKFSERREESVLVLKCFGCLSHLKEWTNDTLQTLRKKSVYGKSMNSGSKNGGFFNFVLSFLFK